MPTVLALSSAPALLTVLVLLIATTLLTATSCSELDPNAPVGVRTGSADFSRYLALGNSLTAGVQSNGLVEKNQRRSYPALIAQASRLEPFEMPLISEPGIPPLLFVSQFTPSIVIDTLPGVGAPTNTLLARIYNNIGIPGATVHDLLVQRPDPLHPNPFFSIVLRDSIAFGPTAVAQAERFQPTFVTLWIGANDIFGSASAGTDLLLTPAMAFEVDFRTLIDRLRAASTGMVVANLPNISAIPFFATIPPILIDPATRQPVLDPTGAPIPLIGEFQGQSGALPPNALLTLAAASFLFQGTGIPISAGGTGNPLPDFVVIDPTELGNINDRLGDFNATIDTVCANRAIPVADMFSLFEDIRANGFIVRGETFTSDFLTGGLFSVDGFHPSSLGYYAIALEFIRTINVAFGASIPDPPLPADPVLTIPRHAYPHRPGTFPASWYFARTPKVLLF